MDLLITREYFSLAESRPQSKGSAGNGNVIQYQIQKQRIHVLCLVFETIERGGDDDRRRAYPAGGDVVFGEFTLFSGAAQNIFGHACA